MWVLAHLVEAEELWRWAAEALGAVVLPAHAREPPVFPLVVQRPALSRRCCRGGGLGRLLVLLSPQLLCLAAPSSRVGPPPPPLSAAAARSRSTCSRARRSCEAVQEAGAAVELVSHTMSSCVLARVAHTTPLEGWIVPARQFMRYLYLQFGYSISPHLFFDTSYKLDTNVYGIYKTESSSIIHCA